MNWYEIIGYSGSVIVAISLMMKNIRQLRKVNLIGSATFAIYGLLLNAYPVFLLNGFIAVVDIYYLYEMNKRKDYFSLMPILDNSHRYLTKFLDFHKKEIEKFFPEFKRDQLKNASCFFILRNLMPVGLFVYREISAVQIIVLIDYAIPDYRDLKNGKFVYDTESDYLREKGYKEIITESYVEKHQNYLGKIGFVQKDKNQNIFFRKI
jgi:hypothetical protein